MAGALGLAQGSAWLTEIWPPLAKLVSSPAAGWRSMTVTSCPALDRNQAEVVPIGAIRVGEAEAQNIMVGVFDLPDAPAGVDGLLGLTFLNHFLVTLDTVKGELSLRRRQ